MFQKLKVVSDHVCLTDWLVESPCISGGDEVGLIQVQVLDSERCLQVANQQQVSDTSTLSKQQAARSKQQGARSKQQGARSKFEARLTRLGKQQGASSNHTT